MNAVRIVQVGYRFHADCSALPSQPLGTKLEAPFGVCRRLRDG